MATKASVPIPQDKICKSCGELLTASSFRWYVRDKCYSNTCVMCENKRSRERYQKNKALLAPVRKKYYEENKGHLIALCIEWGKNNRDKRAIADRKFRLANLSKDCHKVSMRRARRLQATPSWANEFFIQEAYHIASLRTKMTGVAWHVDHIVPLNGKNVCGLHTHDNLQVIPAVLNLQKSNKHG